MFELNRFNVGIATTRTVEKPKMTNRETGKGLLRTRISSKYLR